jgi:ribosome-interacting GTPase 1
MPANLSPEYKAAEAAFRKTREPRERLECLREMLRVIPKHKGTEHLQADIKARIKDLSAEPEGRKGGHRGGPTLVVRPEGAAQVVLLGAPNTGKSSLHARLTGSAAAAGDYPFTTQFPEPGMMPFEDIHFQLVDLPAVSPEHPVPWLAAALQSADAALLVVDLSDPADLEEVPLVRAELAKRRVTLSERWEAAAEDDDMFAVRLPTLLLLNKADTVHDVDDEVRTFLDLSATAFPALPVSAKTGLGLDALGRWLFDHLGIVRVYGKAPGHPPDKSRPFTLRRGDTVADVAKLIHKDIQRSLKYARLWGHSRFEGQQVGPEHPVDDGDVVELHA